MASSMLDMTMAESLIGSPRPNCVSRGERNAVFQRLEQNAALAQILQLDAATDQA